MTRRRWQRPGALAHRTPDKEAPDEQTYCSPVARAQVVAELTKILEQVRAVAEQPDFSLADAEKIVRLVRHAERLVRQAERDRDFDDGVLDVPARDRAALKALDTDGRARS